MNADLMLEVEIDQAAIDRWACLSGDRNPLHVDAEYASGTRFGGTIAHGHMTLALLTHLFVKALGEDWLYGGALEGVRFRAPVRPGQPYRVLGFEEPSEDGDRRWRIEVLDGEGTLCVTGGARLAPADSAP
jgi:acyl dehydratase